MLLAGLLLEAKLNQSAIKRTCEPGDSGRNPFTKDRASCIGNSPSIGLLNTGEKTNMARKPARKPAQKAARIIPSKAPAAFDEESLTKGQLRKLNALRTSVGDKIGTTAFAKWLASHASEPKTTVDKNAEQIVGALEPLVEAKKLRIPQGGYLVRRGRVRVIVTRAKAP